MVPYYGDFPVNATVYIPINTFDSNDPAASVTVTNLLNTDVHIHKDGGTTQRNNAAGITMTIDYDSITGNHLLIIDTSDNTVADFFQAGHEYQVRVEGATVDAGTINAWVGSFSIERSGAALALLKSATYGLAQLVRSTTPANTLSVDANHLVATPDTQKVDLNTIKTQAVTCGAEVTVPASIGTSTLTQTQVTGGAYDMQNGAVTGAIKTALEAGGSTLATLLSRIVGTLAAGTHNPQSGDAYGIANNGTYGNSALKTLIDAIKAITDQCAFTTDGANKYIKADAVFVAGAAPEDSEDIAGAVWDELLSGHAEVGSAGAALAAAGSAGDPWSTPLPGEYGDGTAGKIIGANINAPIGTVDTVVDAIKAITDQITFTGTAPNALANVQVKGQDNIDFGALQKDSLNAATPASVQNIPVDGSLDVNVASSDDIDFTATQKTSLNAATPASVQNIPVDGTLETTVGGYAAGQDPVTLMDAGVPDVNVKTMDDAVISAGKFAANAIEAAAAASDFGAEIAAAILDLANAIETGLTLRNAMRLAAASAAGALTGAGTGTETLKSAVSGSKNRIVGTIDEDGNRTVVTDLT